LVIVELQIIIAHGFILVERSGNLNYLSAERT
jgi:hypothetical protein